MMSDAIFKIFPRYYYQKYTDEKIVGAVNMLKSLLLTEEITFTNYNSVQFIDCGENLKHIFCQWCGRELGIEFWHQAMDKAYKSSFEHLGFKTPCCNLSSSLDELIYVRPCGFATFTIEVHDPTVIPCKHELYEMGKCFGFANFFRMILTHI